MAKYVTLYDPKEHVKKVHQCDLPDLKINRHDDSRKVWWKTIVECEECAQKWVAITYKDMAHLNKWVPLRWYHFKYKRNLRK